MRTRDYRRHEERMKDLRRRRLYRNNAINGRYELSDKEDPDLSLCAVYNKNNSTVRMVEWTAQKETIHPSKLTDDIGHWQEFPKNQNYGSRGYNLKSSKHKKMRQALKTAIDKEMNNDRV